MWLTGASLFSVETEGTSRICNVQISSQESRLGVVEDVGICVSKSVQRGHRIYRLHQHAHEVRIKAILR